VTVDVPICIHPLSEALFMGKPKLGAEEDEEDEEIPG